MKYVGAKNYAALASKYKKKGYIYVQDSNIAACGGDGSIYLIGGNPCESIRLNVIGPVTGSKKDHIGFCSGVVLFLFVELCRIYTTFVESALVLSKNTNYGRKGAIIVLKYFQEVITMKKTSIELCRLGICPNYVGYQEMHLAVQLALEDPTRLTALVQEVYMPVGEATGRNWTAVERNLRTVVRRAWEANPGLLTEIARRPLERGPGTGDFLGMMWVYLTEEDDKTI